MPITAAQVQAVAGNNPAGVSIDLITGRILTGVGFCVAYAATQNNHDLAGLTQSMIHANGPNGSGIIGAWSHGTQIYYDSVKKYTTRVAAVNAAQKERQIAIYNLTKNIVEGIMTPGVGFDPAHSPGNFIPSLTTGRKRSHSF